jgi:hypothetical protein
LYNLAKRNENITAYIHSGLGKKELFWEMAAGKNG